MVVWVVLAPQNERKFRVEKAAELKYTDLPRLQAQYAAALEEIKKVSQLSGPAVLALPLSGTLIGTPSSAPKPPPG